MFRISLFSSKTQNETTEPLIYQKLPVRYGLFERVFRTAVFQFPVYSAGWLEKFLFFIYRAFAKRTICPESYDDKRMDNALDIFKALGGKEKYIVPEDGLAKVHMLHMSSAELEKIITEKGGKWIREGKEFLIILPSEKTADWLEFQNRCLLNGTGWYLAQKNNREVIVTCEHADLVDNRKLGFLHLQHHSFSWHRHRACFYLGMKKDCFFFDASGVRKSEGTPSEKRCYLDAEAVFQDILQQGYKPNQIFVSGSCRSSTIAAHLKRKYHYEGVNFIVEQGFISLEEDMINSQYWFVRLFAKWNLDALKSRDIPSHIGPEEDGFNTRKKWKSLSLSSKGKVIIIHCKRDDTLPKDMELQYGELARKVNRDVFTLYFDVPEHLDGHGQNCLKNKELRNRLTGVIFDKNSTFSYSLSDLKRQFPDS